MSSASVLQSGLILSPTCVQSLAPLAGARHPMVSALLPQCLHCSLHKTVTPEAGTTLVLMFHCFTALVTQYSLLNVFNPNWSCQKLVPHAGFLGPMPSLQHLHICLCCLAQVTRCHPAREAARHIHQPDTDAVALAFPRARRMPQHQGLVALLDLVRRRVSVGWEGHVVEAFWWEPSPEFVNNTLWHNS